MAERRHPSDRALVISATSGDLQAFETLIERYQSIVYRDALRYVREPAQAQDIVQETFVTAFQEMDRLPDPNKFAPWLRGVARHRCLNVLRSRAQAMKTLQTLLRESADSSRILSSPEPDDYNTTSSFHEILAGLPSLSARVMVMHYIEEMSVSTIADRLGLSSQAVKQRLYRARRLIQEEVILMIKNPSTRKILPAGFPGRVIAKLLEQGHKDWLYMRYDQAGEKYTKAMEAMPDDPDVLLAFGNAYDPIRGISAEQIGVLERAYEQKKDSIPVASSLATAYFQAGRTEDWIALSRTCLALCDECLAVYPENLEALEASAEILRFRQNYSEAEKLLRVAQTKAPENQRILHLMALNLSNQGKHEEATALYRKNCTLNDKSFWTYAAMRQLATTIAYQTQGDPQQAVDFMEKVWTWTRKPMEAGNLIYFYSATGQMTEAICLFEQTTAGRRQDRSKSFAPQHPRVYATAGVAYMQKDAWNKAQLALQKAIERSSDEPLRAEIRLHLASVLFASGQKKEARTALEAGLILDPENRSTMLTGGMGSIFWRPWTLWLIETLNRIVRYDERIDPLSRAVCERLETA